MVLLVFKIYLCILVRLGVEVVVEKSVDKREGWRRLEGLIYK